MTFTDREVELLRNAVKCFREIRSPFATDELVKMNVTSSDCWDMSSMIAECIEVVLAHPSLQKMALRSEGEQLNQKLLEQKEGKP